MEGLYRFLDLEQSEYSIVSIAVLTFSDFIFARLQFKTERKKKHIETMLYQLLLLLKQIEK